MKIVSMGPKFHSENWTRGRVIFSWPRSKFCCENWTRGAKFSMKIGPGGPNFMVANLYMTPGVFFKIFYSEKRLNGTHYWQVILWALKGNIYVHPEICTKVTKCHCNWLSTCWPSFSHINSHIKRFEKWVTLLLTI